MTPAEFSQRVSDLRHLDPALIAKAMRISETLSASGRDELWLKCEHTDHQTAKLLQQEDESLTQAEKVMDEAEHAVHEHMQNDRLSQEDWERSRDLQAVDNLLSAES